MAANNPDRPNKPSDLIPFSLKVYEASATMLDFEDYFQIYEELLRMLMWNPDIDIPLAIEAESKQRQLKNGMQS